METFVVAASMTRTEAFVASLCQSVFLKLWTHPNPIGKKGKELCDCLTVCGGDVIIFSVKEISFKDTGDKTGWARWQKAAIDESAQQIWGAERWLQSAEKLVRADGRSVSLPPVAKRRFHRIAVALGGKGEVPIRWGDLGNGFVHVLDEYSLSEIFRELTTISDFVQYLEAVERLFEKGVRPIFSGGGAEDLLALYVRRGETFGIVQEDSSTPDMVIIEGGLWQGLLTDPEYIARNKDLESSYVWDRLIEHFAADLLTDGMFDPYSKLVTKDEQALIAMALQPRGHRANLADAFISFLDPDGASVAARVAVAANSTAFVFVGGDSGDRKYRMQQLALRCLVVRGRCNVTTVVGIATDRPTFGKSGHSTDLAYVHMPELPQEVAARIEAIQRDLGYFKSTKWSV